MTRILLKPGSALVIKEQEEEYALEKSVVYTAQAIAQKTTENKQQWAHLQQQLQAQQPIRLAPVRPPVMPDTDRQASEKISPQERALLITQVRTRIVQRVTHDI